MKITPNILRILESQNLSGIILEDLQNISMQLEFQIARFKRERSLKTAVYYEGIKNKIDKEIGNRALENALKG
jgi:hypothetical protein